MPIRVTCPNPDCGAIANVEEGSLGRRGRCRKCGQVFALARPGGEAASAFSADASAWKGSSSARPAASPADLPEQFGRYRIMKPLGQGGMGAVYLALDTTLDRQVALKVPYFSPADGPQAVQRFRREARAAATLDHPNLCPVYDVGEVDGIHYLTMPYIQGKTLADAVPEDQTFAESQAAAVIRKLALALQEAHDKGIIHRDLKPGNIMVNRRREMIIMDFGLARVVDGDDQPITRDGHVLGTALYMAPEQAAGDAAAIGPACDVYSLGVILHELLTGRRPFEGPWSLVIGLKNVKDPDPPSTHRPGLDPALEAICQKALARDPKGRYATMAEFAHALGGFLSRGSMPADTPATPSGAAPPVESPEGPAVPVFEGLADGEASSPLGRRPIARPGGQAMRLPGRAKLIASAGAAGLLLGAGVLYLAADRGRTGIDPKAVVRGGGDRAPKVDISPTGDGGLIINALDLRLKLIPAGEFLMGSDTSDRLAVPAMEQVDGRKHRVRITRPFYMGDAHVTVAQFRRFVEETGYRTSSETNGIGGQGWDDVKGASTPLPEPRYTWRSPGHPQGDDHPVVVVSWSDAEAFCRWLGRKEGGSYRLPTEAEWEYACRAGTSTRFWTGDDESVATVGNLADATLRARFPKLRFAMKFVDGHVYTSPVRSFRPNPFGLYDMHGNVWTMCSDSYEEGYYARSPVDDPKGPGPGIVRVIRGGSWINEWSSCRSANRNRGADGAGGHATGFRVVRDVDGP